jgi:hypothetical protein
MIHVLYRPCSEQLLNIEMIREAGIIVGKMALEAWLSSF